MSFPVTAINQPLANGNFGAVRVGDAIAAFNNSGILSVFDMVTETTTVAWQMTSPSGSHPLANPATPAVDADGNVWTFTGNITGNVMFIRINPVTGATSYYPTSEPSYNGHRRCAVVDTWVVGFAGGAWIRFNTLTGVASTGAGGGAPACTQPWVHNGRVYARQGSGYGGVHKFNPATNAVESSGFSSHWFSNNVVDNAQPALRGGKIYTTCGSGVIVHDLATETSSVQPVPSGFLGAALVLHDDDRFYSNPSGSLVGCWDPDTFEVASASQSCSGVFAASYNGYVYIPSA